MRRLIVANTQIEPKECNSLGQGFVYNEPRPTRRVGKLYPGHSPCTWSGWLEKEAL